jgi:hypothetical protein
MSIPNTVRNQLLIEARHRCTICTEKCFEIHHIIEQSEGGTDDPENLIVLCPNCHQHRYHRSKEFTKDQLRIYKAKLKEQNEIEHRLLLNLEEMRQTIGNIPLEEIEKQLQNELIEAAGLVSQDRSPAIFRRVQETTLWLAERELIRGGARKAIELEWEIQLQRRKAEWEHPNIIGIDEDGWEKAPDFQEAYKLVFKLDRTPSYQWSEAFEQTYRHSLNLHKRRTFISGNRMIMIVGSSDNLQEHADYAKQLIQETDELVQSLIIPRINADIENQKLLALREFDTMRSLQGRTKDIKL